MSTLDELRAKRDIWPTVAAAIPQEDGGLSQL